jgi:riboflavin transporter FmnP
VRSGEIRALTEANAELKATNRLQEKTIKFLQVTVAVLLACTCGLAAGLAICLARASALTAFSSAFGVFVGVIMASVAILTYMHR